MSKIIINIVIIIVIISISSFVSNYLTKRSLDSRIDEYKSTITQLGTEIKGLREQNKRISEINQSVTNRLEDSIKRAARAESLITEIGDGLSGATQDIQSIIRAIERIIEALREYEEE